MQELQNSKVKTENSVIDNISVHDILPSSDQVERTEQLVQICQWFDKRVRNGSLSASQTSYSPLQNSQHHYFMVKLDSLHQLPFRRVHKGSKVNLHLLSTLVNLKSGTKYQKSCRLIKSLEQSKSSYLFELKESTCFYFYTPNEKEILLRIEIFLSEQYQSQSEANREEPVNIHLNAQFIGFIEITFEKEVKSKEKKRVMAPIEHNIFAKKEHEHQMRGAFCEYYLINSEAYKYLQKLVNPNVLCDSTDQIAGVMGGFLPLNQHALSDFAIMPEAQGLFLQITSLNFNSLLLKDAKHKCEVYAKSIYQNTSKLNFSTKELLLKVFFHNAWKIVSYGETVLKQKQIDRVQTNQSLVSALHHNKSKENISIIKQTEGRGFKRGAKLLNYVPEQNITLGLVFPAEEECVLILQIELVTDVTGEFEKDGTQQELLKEKHSVPVCFALISAKGLSLHRYQTLHFYRGCGLSSYQHISEMIAKNMNLIEITQKRAFQISKSKKSLGQIEDGSLSAIKSIKTMSNATNVFAKKAIGQMGTTEFQVNFRDKDPLVVTTLENISLMLDNLSGINLSRGDLKDKINAEKQRILKETKKAIQIKKKMGIQFHPSMLINDKQKGEIILTVQKAPQFKKMKEKEELLSYLRKMFPELSRLQHSNSGSFSQPQLIHQQSSTSKIYYSLRLSNRKQSSFCESLKLTPYFYLLNSNYQFPINYSFYLYEKTPIEIIHTELSELNYNNCFFFNFLNIVSTTHQSLLKFPKTFFFKTRFWNHQQIRSELMTINKDTGQIILFNFEQSSQLEQNKQSKIMHQEITFNDSTDNFQQAFIYFIEYLYNGLLKMEMIDYETGHTYGSFMVPLRNLIRKRRNEAIITHEDYIVHRSSIRGKIKAQVRCLRKMKQKPKIILPSAQTNLKQSVLKGKESSIVQNKKPQQKDQSERIKARIMKFKQNKNRRNSPQKQSPQKINSLKMNEVKPQDEDLSQQTKKIQNIFAFKFIRQRKVLQVCSLKKYFFFITVQNNHSQASSFRLSIIDQDESYINQNPLSEGEQISLVKNIDFLQKQDREKLLSIKQYKDKIDRFLKIQSENSIELEGKQKKYLLLCYMTVRKFKNWKEEEKKSDKEGKLLSIYNRERIINCSLINQINQTVQAIYSIQIVPVPEETNIQLQFYRPQNQRSFIHIPFIDTAFIEQEIDQILIDDPFILVSAANNINKHSYKMLINTEKGLLLQINNQLKGQQCKEINMLFINGAAEKEKGYQSRKIQKSRSKSRIQLHDQYSYGPQTLSISLKIWGCLKFSATVELWKQSEVTFKLQTQFFCNFMSTYCFYLLSQNPMELKIRKNQKIKSEAPQIFKIMKENEVILFHCSITSNKVGMRYININVVEGKDVLEQQEALSKNVFKEVWPVYRIVLSLQTKFPSLKELIKININRSSQQKIIEEPFSYQSSCLKKTEFKVISSDSNLIWAKNTDCTFHLEPKSERKVSILFHIENILDNSGLSGESEFALIGVKWDRGLDYFGFKFNIT